MRDLLVVGLALLGSAYALKNPYVGVLTYYWISVMNPHRYSWGFAYDFPLAMIAAAATLASLAIHYRSWTVPRCREFYLFLLLWAHVTLTTIYAFYPEPAWKNWNGISKIFLMIVAAMVVLTTRQRLMMFLVALTGFVGFIGVKGAIFGITTGGQFKVWGPPESFLADNNSMGLAMIMVVPMAFLLKDLVEERWQKLALFWTGVCLIISTVLTYSRGAFLGLSVVCFLIILRARRRLWILAVAVLLIGVASTAMPQRWVDRMSTIKEYEEDDSANMRMNSWAMSYQLALDNPLGGGFGCYTMDQYYAYAPDPELGRTKSGAASVAHSIYFEVLAMHGFGGLAIYLAAIVSALWSLRKLYRLSRARAEAAWVGPVADALTLSIVGFLISGAFLSRALFDLFWALFGAATCLKYHVLAGNWLTVSEPEAAPPPREKGRPGPLGGRRHAPLTPRYPARR